MSFARRSGTEVSGNTPQSGLHQGERLHTMAVINTPNSLHHAEHFVHTYEGPDDMPGHVKCSLLGPSLLAAAEDDGKLRWRCGAVAPFLTLPH